MEESNGIAIFTDLRKHVENVHRITNAISDSNKYLHDENSKLYMETFRKIIKYLNDFSRAIGTFSFENCFHVKDVRDGYENSAKICININQDPKTCNGYSIDEINNDFTWFIRIYPEYCNPYKMKKEDGSFVYYNVLDCDCLKDGFIFKSIDNRDKCIKIVIEHWEEIKKRINGNIISILESCINDVSNKNKEEIKINEMLKNFKA